VRSGEVADLAGVNVQTLRYYERRGLVPEPPRAPSGYRAYPDSVVGTIRFVKRAQELGFTLAEVAELLQLAEGGPDECDTARQVAQTRVRDLERKISDLQRMRDSLVDLLATCHRPRVDRRCPLLRALHTGREEPR
jgi:MerR family mercuric resistance operon transcriptional regulator